MSTTQKLSIFQFPLISLVCGIVAQQTWPLSCSGLIVCLCSSAILAALASKKLSSKGIRIGLISFFFFIGAFLFQLKTNRHISQLKHYQDKNLAIIGIVTDKEKIDSFPFNQRFTINVTDIKEGSALCFQPASFSIHVYTKKNNTVLPADTVQLNNITIQLCPNESLAGHPSFNDYLIKENILATIFTPQKIICWKRPTVSLSRWIWQKRDYLRQHIKQKLSITASHYFSLIFLGYKQETNRHYDKNSLRHIFNDWGITHYLARSGLHIVLFIFLWKFLFSFIPLHLTLKRALLILLCVLYSLFSWTSIPFTRAYFLFLLIQCGFILGRQTNFLHILSLFTTMLLLINPHQVFFLDFQLSFGLTFALAWLTSIS
ncbi:MAG: ComEC/Rec2 family competence protein [bacterium]